MATRAPFLKARYSGYHHRQVPREDAELTHVGPDSPCGEVHAAVLAADLLLRRTQGPAGRTEDPRRGAGGVPRRQRRGRPAGAPLSAPRYSLEFGLVGAKGIRCCYHGWLFDVDGTILETPGEPATSTLKDRLCHGAYPVHETHGMVFAYMGPPDRMPAFPTYDTFDRPGYRMIPGQKYFYPCNWLQILENTMDAVHTAFLHTIVSGAVFTDEFGVLPELEFAETPVGIIYIATRRVGDNVWARMVENVLPNLQQVAPIWENGQQAHPFSGPMMSRWIVPLDDTNTMLIEFRHISETEGVVTPDWWADRGIMLPGQLGADSYEESQRRPGDFEAQVSQRPVAVHGLEHLGTTDRGITMFRNQVRKGIRAVKEGSDPVGLFRDSSVIPTYCNDTVVRVPPAKTPELDKKLLRETGRRLAQGYIEAPPLMAAAE